MTDGRRAAESLERWFRAGHRPLPWRNGYAPYHVWLSEVMLQQTQVETVLPYYARFLERFPTIEVLAGADLDKVLALWSGLGYYSRARNLHAAVRRIVSDHGGQVPDDYDLLLGLPGIGRYMAGAILSIAFNKPFPVVDGNVRRILSRRYGWVEPKDSDIWKAAAQIAESGAPRVVNQAMMELGATICTFRAPRCESCPWTPRCAAYGTGRQAELPAPRKHRATVRVDLHAVIDENRNGFLMRHEDGLWKFPLLPDLPPGTFTKLGTCRHSITHHRLEVSVYRGRLAHRDGYRRVRFDTVPVTSLTRKIHAVARGSRDETTR